MRSLVSTVRRLRSLVVPRPCTISVGPGKGLRFDAGPSNPAYMTGDNELPVQEALVRHLHRGAVFYDVGANVGFLSVVGARLVGDEGRVYAFEPAPGNAALARRNAAANGFKQLRVIEKALTRRSGTGDLALARHSGGAVLADVGRPPDPAGTLTVALASMDDLVERCGLEPPSFVKIDVEGAELDVFEGMQRTLARFRPTVLYEIDDPEHEGLSRKQTACEEWLRARDYRIAELPASYPAIRWLVKHFLATPCAPRMCGEDARN